MTQLALPGAKSGRWRRMADKVFNGVVVGARVAATVARAKAPVARQQLVDHAYSIIGFGLFDSAMFVHSVFTGLLVTGLSFLAFEWKVSEE